MGLLTPRTDTDPCDSFFVELLDSLAPEADDLVVIIKSYFDESHGNENDPHDPRLLCVAGYAFTSRKARELDAAWKRMLRNKRLPYFRMSACNGGWKPFDQLTEDECIAVATRAIGLINKHAVLGCAVTVDEVAFDKIMTSRGVVSTPYELCAWLVVLSVQYHIRRYLAPGPIAYFFERGFRHESLAQQVMMRISEVETKRPSPYGFGSYAFVDKRCCRPLQTADLFAWQWFKHAKRLAAGKTRQRGDLAALIGGNPHFAHHVDAAGLRSLVSAINLKAGTHLGNEIAGLAMRDPDNAIFPRRKGETGDEAAYAQLLKDHEGRS